ncbi:hypothetical protein [Bradyrhizobium oligotrophicum]|uniref:hypothetical protein n=1 Tax=Bradyrhizobium oligotrophicum TaxID=44255 RepID=UPI003EBFBBDB
MKLAAIGGGSTAIELALPMAKPAHGAPIRTLNSIDVPLGASPLPAALNVYYDNLVKLLQPSAKNKVALNNVVTPADIYSNTNFYDQYIFRTFVDRLVVTSPENYTLGNANVSSAYSYYWIILLERAIADIDISLDSPAQNQIDEMDRQIGDLRDKYSKVKLDLETRWNAFAQAAGIDAKTDKYYIFKKKKFADDGGYATQLSGIRHDIALRLTKQMQIRLKSVGDNEEDRILISTYQYASFDEYKELLPIIPDFEKNDGLSASDLTNLAVTGASGQFESGMDIRPVGDLRNFFGNTSGKNSIGIDQSSTYEHNHDSEWGVSASGGWSWFSASVSSDNESHIRESMSDVKKVTIGWANLASVAVRRGRWFNLDILGYKRIAKILKNDPRLKGQLSRTVSSLVLMRGLSIILEFNNASSLERWQKSTFSGSAGVSIFGIGFGGGGSSYDYDWSLQKDSSKKTVTITDDPNYARVAAFLSEPVISGVSAEDIAYDFVEPRYYNDSTIEKLKVRGGTK